MNTAIKAAIALGAVSFASTLWVLRTGPDAPQPDAATPPAVREPIASDPPSTTPVDFRAALLAAAQVGSSPEGLKYQEEAGPALSNAIQERLSGCLVGSSPLGQAAFTVVVGVAPDGGVTSSWASPETPLASCVLRRLAGAALPPTAIPGVWMAANITPDAIESVDSSERSE